jgi:hypothetical protein
MPRVGVIGPTDVALIERVVSLHMGTLERTARRFGVFLAQNCLDLVCVPDRGVALWALESYRESGGNQAFALSPVGADTLDDPRDETPTHTRLAQSVRRDMTWDEAPAEMVRECDCFVCFGLSCGTLVELAWTKWIKQFPVFVMQPYVSGIPIEIASEIDLRLFNTLDDIEDAVRRFCIGEPSS